MVQICSKQVVSELEIRCHFSALWR